MPVLPGPPALEITLRRSARARRFSLRVSALDGKVTLTLPPRARAVLVLHDVEGWKHEEISDELGMAVGSSKAQLHRARNLLKQWLGGPHGRA